MRSNRAFHAAPCGRFEVGHADAPELGYVLGERHPVLYCANRNVGLIIGFVQNRLSKFASLTLGQAHVADALAYLVTPANAVANFIAIKIKTHQAIIQRIVEGSKPHPVYAEWGLFLH